MGMDVIGKNPVSEAGEYFRNNVWWWKPLWSYCGVVAPELCDGIEGNFNVGDGLDEEGAIALAEALQSEIDSGHTLLIQVEIQKEDLEYYFSVENVQGFVNFLFDCGGFEIR